MLESEYSKIIEDQFVEQSQRNSRVAYMMWEGFLAVYFVENKEEIVMVAHKLAFA